MRLADIVEQRLEPPIIIATLLLFSSRFMFLAPALVPVALVKSAATALKREAMSGADLASPTRSLSCVRLHRTQFLWARLRVHSSDGSFGLQPDIGPMPCPPRMRTINSGAKAMRVPLGFWHAAPSHPRQRSPLNGPLA